MSAFHTLTDLALRVDELLFGHPENLVVVRQLVETCLADPVQKNFDSLRDSLRLHCSSEEEVVLTTGQRAVALSALHAVHCSGVEKVIATAEPQWEDGQPSGWSREVRWLMILDLVMELGDDSLPWFTLQFRRF